MWNNLNNDYVSICRKTMRFHIDWQRERKLRLTGSICYEFFTYVKNKKPDWKKKCRSFLATKIFKSEYTEYGKEKEKEARDIFVNATNHRVLQTGLIICKQNPWLGFSPDGIIFDDIKPVALLEIKCPFKGKSMNIAEAMNHEFGKCLVFSDDSKISLKKRNLSIILMMLKFSWEWQ